MRNYKMLLVMLLCCFCLPIYSQPLQVDADVRKSLNKFLRDIGATGNRLYDEVNLHVWDLLSDKNIIQNSDMREIGIYGFNTIGSGQNTYILLKHGDNYEVFPMTEGRYNESRSYSSILDDLQDYFIRYPDIDYRLLPLYNKIVYEIYEINTKTEELGPWFDWYEKEQKKYTQSY